MAYTVLARKYRSRTFDEVIGQEPIATTLANAIKSARVHHGYLFTGTRGSGKTSMARILAKSLNCLNSEAPTITPCLKCDSCIGIAEGQDLDVIEIDAASNTGVDNIRELRSNATYRPARARFKIYIIDEVHMLSTGAFNALLKTLEEPPEHVKFILATTEIQKVPATIQSRCQRFNFRNIGADAIAKRLADIVKAEGAKSDAAVLRRIARLANGSMRDALSILDQLMAVSATELSLQALDEIIPPAQDEQVFALLKASAAGDAAGALQALETILSGGRGVENFCNDAIDVIRTLMLIRTCGPKTEIVDIPAGALDEYTTLSATFAVSQYVQMIAMLEELKRSARFSGAGRALADAVVVRLAHMLAWSPIETLIEHLPAGEAADSFDASKKKDDRLIAAPATAPGPGRPASPAASIPTPQRPADQPREPQRAAPNPSATPAAAAAHRAPLRAASVPQPVDAQQFAAERDDPPRQIPEEAPVMPEPRMQVIEVTGEGRAQVMQDPVVRQVMELFDAVVVSVERRVPLPEPLENQE